MIKSLSRNILTTIARRQSQDVSLLGYHCKLKWSQNEQGLTVILPEKTPSNHALALRIKGVL